MRTATMVGALCLGGVLAACSTLPDLERDDRQCRALSIPGQESPSLASYDRCMQLKGHPWH